MAPKMNRRRCGVVSLKEISQTSLVYTLIRNDLRLLALVSVLSTRCCPLDRPLVSLIHPSRSVRHTLSLLLHNHYRYYCYHPNQSMLVPS